VEVEDDAGAVRWVPLSAREREEKDTVSEGRGGWAVGHFPGLGQSLPRDPFLLSLEVSVSLSLSVSVFICILSGSINPIFMMFLLLQTRIFILHNRVQKL
jgi:hypothetical protein